MLLLFRSGHHQLTASRRQSDAKSDIWTSWKIEESDQKSPSLA